METTEMKLMTLLVIVLIIFLVVALLVIFLPSKKKKNTTWGNLAGNNIEQKIVGNTNDDSEMLDSNLMYYSPRNKPDINLKQ